MAELSGSMEAHEHEFMRLPLISFNVNYVCCGCPLELSIPVSVEDMGISAEELYGKMDGKVARFVGGTVICEAVWP